MPRCYSRCRTLPTVGTCCHAVKPKNAHSLGALQVRTFRDRIAVEQSLLDGVSLDTSCESIEVPNSSCRHCHELFTKMPRRLCSDCNCHLHYAAVIHQSRLCGDGLAEAALSMGSCRISEAPQAPQTYQSGVAYAGAHMRGGAAAERTAAAGAGHAHRRRHPQKVLRFSAARDPAHLRPREHPHPQPAAGRRCCSPFGLNFDLLPKSQ